MGVGDVGGHRDRWTVRAVQLCCQGFERVPIARGKGDRCPRVREGAGDRGADAAAGANDDRDFVLEWSWAVDGRWHGSSFLRPRDGLSMSRV
jgi:hypothetical protein